jgi:hypothetical protein
VHAVQHEVEHELEHEEHARGHKPRGLNLQQEGSAADRGDRAVPRVFRDARQERADGGTQFQRRSFESWAFYQAKNIRQTSLQAANEILKLERLKADAAAPDAIKTALNQRIDTWEKTVVRYESEPREREVRKEVNLNPPYGEGRRELMALAAAAEAKRDTALERYHHYEVASAAFQIGIVLASATVITGMIVLSYLAGALGILGIVFMSIGFFAPHAVHLF